jgi:4-diphosphocytidyl-2-C-methyl-D-erythritol kinase
VIKSICLRAHGKINPTIEITGIDKGILNLDMTWQAVDIYDLIEIKWFETLLESASADKTLHIHKIMQIEITCDNKLVPQKKEGFKNNCWKAAETFFLKSVSKNICIPEKIEINIKKKIPLGGGLGGSSADAAAVTIGLNRLSGNVFSLSELIDLGACTGHDNAFFCSPWAAARGNERRNNSVKLKSINSMGNVLIIAFIPDFEITAAQVYQSICKNFTIDFFNQISAFDKTEKNIKEKNITEEFVNALEIKNDYRKYSSKMKNQLELSSVIQSIDLYKRLKKFIYDNKGCSALLSGSGSTYLGIFDSSFDYGYFKRKFYQNFGFEKIKIKKMQVHNKSPVEALG